MVNEQRKTQHTALGDPGQGMDIVHAEGLKGGGEEGDDAEREFQFHNVSLW